MPKNTAGRLHFGDGDVLAYNFRKINAITNSAV
jgi:hypothetical protein